jgi:RNA polymerase sigma factor (sigma-70 family)
MRDSLTLTPLFTEHGLRPSETIHRLLARMREGDREAAAEFVTRYGSRIRRRIRGKLAASMRRLFDSQEILSTLGRRLDLYIRAGRFNAADESQLWSLVFRMAGNAVVDKARVFRRLEQVESSDGDFARLLLERLERADSGRSAAGRSHSGSAETEIETALHALPDHMDREILSMWLNGLPHSEIACEVGIAETSVRKRWQRIKQRLRTHMRATIR